MNKSMQPCDAGIKKRRAVEGQASFENNNYTDKSTPSNVKNNRISLKKALFIFADIAFYVLIASCYALVLLGDKQ